VIIDSTAALFPNVPDRRYIRISEAGLADIVALGSPA
jgi:hypothetical protein